MAEGNRFMAEAAQVRPAAARRNVPSIVGWCLYDWANSAFNTVIGTFVFAVYFARGIFGDEIEGSALWALTIGLSGLAVAVLSPVLGAIADRRGRRKPWVALFVAITAMATAGLWFAEPDRAFVAYALILVAIASIAFELANVFYNAMLPVVAPPGYAGRVSGWGWGLGYLGGLACLVVALVALVQPDVPWFGIGTENAANIRATAVLVAIWFVVFAIPLFVMTRDTPPTAVGFGQAVRDGLRQLRQTFADVRRYGQIVRFLIASALYRDGLATLFAVGGLYAAGTFGMSFEQILVFAIGLNVTAGLGAGLFSFVDDAVGSRTTILVGLAGLLALGIPVLVVADANWFIGLALGLGLFVGPVQAASRTLMARLAPPDMATEMFGLYALTGKSVAFLGPITFAVLTDVFDSQRAGMASIIVFLAVGGAILLTVRAR